MISKRRRDVCKKMTIGSHTEKLYLPIYDIRATSNKGPHYDRKMENEWRQIATGIF